MRVNKTGIASVLLFSGIWVLSVSSARAETDSGKQASAAVTTATSTSRVVSGTGVIAPNSGTSVSDSGYDLAQVNVTVPLWVGRPVYNDGGHYYWEDSQRRTHSIPPQEYQRYHNHYHRNGDHYDYHK